MLAKVFLSTLPERTYFTISQFSHSGTELGTLSLLLGNAVIFQIERRSLKSINAILE